VNIDMTRQIVIRALLFGIIAGTAIAVAMTYLDWKQNPGGIFRGQLGTDLSIVLETAASWFIGSLPVASLLALPVMYWLTGCRGDNRVT
jgi:hypothetical protein